MTSSNDMKLSDLIKKNTRIHGNHGYISQIKKQITEFPISDIVDDDGNQYVDLVMEGGGVWGIALVGFTYTLEQAGIRFLNLGGTSAGAINAVLLAALGKPSEEKNIELLNIFDSMQLEKFIDGGFIARSLVKDLQKYEDDQSIFMKSKIILKVIGAVAARKLCPKVLGLNPGHKFEDWLETTLTDKGISTTKELFNNLQNSNLKIRNIEIRKFRPFDESRFENDFKTNVLAMVTSDIITESKIVLPQMAPLYWENPLTTHPKEYVRASMSIPLFFEPVRRPQLKEYPKDSWKVLTGYEGPPPELAYLVDGGITSNFPIDVFHSRDCIPLCPTFGVKLGVDREQSLKIDWILNFVGAMFDTARHNSDYSFVYNNEDYRKIITFIDTAKIYNPIKEAKNYIDSTYANLPPKNESQKYGWLEFGMSTKKKAALFALGAKAARDFICGNQVFEVDPNEKVIEPFDWRAYKVLRESLVVQDPPAYRKWKEQIRQHSLFP